MVLSRSIGALALVCAALLPATLAGAATSTTTARPSTSTTTRPRATTTTTARRNTSTTASPSATTTGPAASPPSGPPASITLVRQSPIVELNKTPVLLLRVRVKNPPSRAAVQVALHQPTTSSLGFADAMQRGELPPHLDDTPVTLDLAQEPTASDGSVLLAYPLQLPGQPPLAETLKLIAAGVYALDVRLVHCGSCRPLVRGTALVTCSTCPVVDSFVTWVVAVSGQHPAGVDVAWVWQLASEPIGVDGSLSVVTRNALAEHGRLARITAALDASTRVPITLAVAGETMQAWKTAATRDAGSARSLAAFTKVLARRQPELVLAPWVPIDERSVDQYGIPDMVRSAFASEAGAVRAAIGVEPERSTAWLDHADDQTLADLRALGVEQAGMREGELQPIDAALGHTRVSVTGSPIGVLTDDAFLTDQLTNPRTDPPALRVQRFVAATALLAYDQPGRRSGVVLATAPDWEPDPAMVAELSFAARTDPLLHFGTLDAAFADVAAGNDGRGGPLVRAFAPRRPEAFAVPAARIAPVRASLTGFASVVGPNDVALVSARESLLVAMSKLVGPDDAQHRLDAIDAMLARFSRSVQVSARGVTLTSARSSIPITFTNTTGTTVHLRVELISDKLQQPAGSGDVTLPPTPVNQTKPLPVSVKASGKFVVTIEMRSTVGTFMIGQPTRITVTSRVFGSWGTWLTYGALLFLALWWAHHFLRRRRRTVVAE